MEGSSLMAWYAAKNWDSCGPKGGIQSKPNMKQLSTLRNIVCASAALALMAARGGACQTVATNDAELVASKKEFLLAQSGFKVITVTTPKQQQTINGLAQYRVSAWEYNGKLSYLCRTA